MGQLEDFAGVSGNGIRFVLYLRVWRAGGTEEEEVVQGALIHDVKAGFVAMHEGDAARFSQSFEGIGHAVDLGDSGVVAGLGPGLEGDLAFDQAGFERPGAAQAPVRGDHFLDEAELYAIDWLKTVQVLAHKNVKCFARLIFQDHATREQSMIQSVLRRALLSFGRYRAAGAGSVGFR